MRSVPGSGASAMSDAPCPAGMGIINVTPDSFSDGGVHFDHPKAIHSAMQMEEDGASYIDVGGESTRPGSEEIAIDVELARVIPVIEGIRKRSAITISIAPRKARPAEAPREAGENITNDVSALRHDPEMRVLAAKRSGRVILMHMRGEPRTMRSEERRVGKECRSRWS